MILCLKCNEPTGDKRRLYCDKCKRISYIVKPINRFYKRNQGKTYKEYLDRAKIEYPELYPDKTYDERTNE